MYLENAFLQNDTLLSFLHDSIGLRQQDVAKKILFVCDRNQRESVLALALARMHASRNGLFMLDVFSSAATNQVDASSIDEGREKKNLVRCVLFFKKKQKKKLEM